MTSKMEMTTIVTGNESFFRDHLHELIDIDKRSFGADAWHEQHFMKPLPGKFDNSLFLMSGNAVVGYSILYESGPSTLHVSRIVVDQAAKGSGYGKQLITASLKKAAEKSYKYVTLEFDNSLGVEGFYKKLGFEKLSENAVKDSLKKNR